MLCILFRFQLHFESDVADLFTGIFFVAVFFTLLQKHKAAAGCSHALQCCLLWRGAAFCSLLCVILTFLFLCPWQCWGLTGTLIAEHGTHGWGAYNLLPGLLCSFILLLQLDKREP